MRSSTPGCRGGPWPTGSTVKRQAPRSQSGPGRLPCSVGGPLTATVYLAELRVSTALECAMSQALVEAAISSAAPSMWAATSSAGMPL